MKKASSLVSVIVVNYNRKSYLQSCLESITLQSFSPLEIIVVDNASIDGSVDMLRQDYPAVRIIENRKNRYFGSAYNQGINVSKGELVLCLNNDVVLAPDLITLLFKKKDIDARIGMWGGKTLRMDKETIDTTGLFLDKSRKPLDRGYAQKDCDQYEREGYVFGIGGSVVLFRRRMLEEIQIDGEYFDEDFRVFYEDLDLCWRAHRFGWKAYYVPKAIAYHKRGATTKEITTGKRLLKQYSLPFLSHELQAHFVKNRYATIIKNDSLFQLLLNGFFILLYECRLWGFLILFSPKTIGIVFQKRDIFKKSFKKRTMIFKRLKQLQIEDCT